MISKRNLIPLTILIFILLAALFATNKEDITGQAAKVSTKTITKITPVKTTAITKTTTLSAKKGKFCGDASCVDGTHVSCYENTKGDCECEKCKISSKSWEFQKPLKGIQKSLKEKKAVKFSLSKINIGEFLPLCQTERRYETGAPIIDAFMMEFLGETDEATLGDFAELLEVAYCDATDGEIVIKITPVKYTSTKSTQFMGALDYQPFMEEDWDETFDELANDEEYGHEWVEETKALTYGDFLPEDVIDGFFYEWLYDRSIYADTFDYDSGFNAYARQMGYDTENYDLLIIVGGVYNEDYNEYYRTKYNVIYSESEHLTLCPDCEGYIYRLNVFEVDAVYALIDGAIHEIGHFTGGQHACETSYPNNCDTCRWSDDVMSYCADNPARGETFYNEFLSCSLGFFQQYYIPYHRDGSGDSGVNDEYYSCE